MLDSTYYMTLNLLKIAFRRENVKSLTSFTQLYNEHETLLNLQITTGASI